MVESKTVKIVCICVTVVCVFVIMNYTVFSSGLSPNKKEKLKRREESEQVRKRNHEYLVNSLSTFAKEDRVTKLKVDTVGVRGHADPVTIPYPKVLDKMDVPQLEELYYSYVENIQILCTRQRHIGNEEDGGYHICEDIIQPDKPCLMYSFGIRKDFSFDDGIAKHYGCEVHSFDPFDGQFDHIHSPKVTFHSLGIGDKDDPQGKILTLKTIKGNLNHTKVKIDILKIDVEGAEWDSLTEMVNSNALDDVRILIVEFHICIKNCLDGRHRKKEQYAHYLNVLKSIYAVGFRIYFLRMWPYCGFEENGIARTTCHEIHMLKI